jgi:predicted DNA-binding transcriptional regulator AlpA
MTGLLDEEVQPDGHLASPAMPPDPIGLSEIAAILGVTTRTVKRYADRPELGFPDPVWIGGRRIWKRNEVERWAKRTLPLQQGRPPAK